jgi:hypothetical protein
LQVHGAAWQAPANCHGGQLCGDRELGYGEGERTCFRVAAVTDDQSDDFELYFDHGCSQWILRRVLD